MCFLGVFLSRLILLLFFLYRSWLYLPYSFFTLLLFNKSFFCYKAILCVYIYFFYWFTFFFANVFRLYPFLTFSPPFPFNFISGLQSNFASKRCSSAEIALVDLDLFLAVNKHFQWSICLHKTNIQTNQSASGTMSVRERTHAHRMGECTSIKRHASLHLPAEL